MSSKFLTHFELKSHAKALRQALHEQFAVELKHSDCLELLAKMHGLKDWNTLASLAPEVGKPSLVVLPENSTITPDTIDRIVNYETEYRNEECENLRPVLKHTLTTGDLKKHLQDVRNDLPIKLAVYDETTEEGGLSFQEEFCISATESTGYGEDGPGYTCFVLEASRAEIFDVVKRELEIGEDEK
jgi:hypothetical protein